MNARLDNKNQFNRCGFIAACFKLATKKQKFQAKSLLGLLDQTFANKILEALVYRIF